MSLSANVELATLEGATLEVCVNDGCTVGTIVTHGEDAPEFNIGDKANAAEEFVAVAEENNGWVRLEMEISTSKPWTRQNGDVYHVRLITASGEVLADEEQTVDSYSEFYPNGPECDDEPCREATIAF